MKPEPIEAANACAQITPALMRVREAAAYTGMSERQWWKMVSAGKAPRPIELPGRMARWRRGDIDQWLASL